MSFVSRACWPLSALLSLAPFAMVAAQDVPSSPLTAPASTDDLAVHLRTLARYPRDLNALIGAGQSALSVGDATAALSFFGRANEVAPNDGRVKAGLGSTLLLMERPDDALRLFSEAVALGVPQSSIAIDRGLAFDLRGDQMSAQRDYRLALQSGQSDELVRRFALSLGISGQKNDALTRLDPLLRKQDQAAWRDRSFILAMNGDVRGATSIARSIMPQQAEAMTPFLKRLANFSPSQRALAVTYGTMPEDTRPATQVPPSVIPPPQLALAKPVGVLMTPTPQPRFETPRPFAKPATVTLPAPLPAATPPLVPNAPPRPVVRPTPKLPPVAQPDPAPYLPPKTLALPAPAPVRVPAPELDTAVAAVDTTAEAIRPDQVSTPQSAPSPVPAPLTVPPYSPAMVSTPVVPKTIIVPPPQPIEHADIASVSPAVGQKPAPMPPATSEPSPGFATANVAPPGPVQIAVVTPAKTAIAAPPPVAVTAKPRFSMASLLDDVTPEVQTPAAHVLSDKELRAARLVAKKKADEKTRLDAEAKAKADAERAAEAEKRAAARQNPAREWVQVATGNNRAGFGHTWAKLKDGHAALLSGKSAYFAPVNHTYRILVGPFADADDARALAKKLQNAGLAVHTFSSEAGQEVARIGGRTRSANEDASRDEKPARKRHKTRASVDGSADTGSADTAHKSGRGDVTAPSGDEPKRKRRRR